MRVTASTRSSAGPRSSGLALALLAALLPAGSLAAGFTEHGQDLVPRPETRVDVGGELRARGVLLENLDLDRGLTPSGQPLYPVPLADPTGQLLTGADLRLRTDLSLYPAVGSLAVKLRLDVLDGVALGSAPVGAPAATTSQAPAALQVKRVWGEALTPVGLLAVGRMGSQWGLGLLANAGDCEECDSGDAADRVAFITPLLGHLFAAAYDFSATGPSTRGRYGRVIDLEPTDDVRTVTFAVLRVHDDLARERRRGAGKTSFEYGAYVSHRRQEHDVPASYLATAQPVAIDAGQVVARGYRATALDGWARLTLPFLRLEAEGAVILARIDQASLIPGVELRDPVTGTQVGLVLQSDLGEPDAELGGGLDAGYASGDPAPGFGASGEPGTTAVRAGELDGPQASPPFDTAVDNFRFHSDYRVDRILFREIIGTVTDAVYLRPHARFTFARAGSGAFALELAAIASTAVHATSTPGGKAPLGIELDPSVGYRSRDGFALVLDYAVLFPLAGLDNPVAGMPAHPAQLVRVRSAYRF